MILSIVFDFEWLHHRNFVMCKDKTSQSSSCILFCWWNFSHWRKKVRKGLPFWFVAFYNSLV